MKKIYKQYLSIPAITLSLLAPLQANTENTVDVLAIYSDGANNKYNGDAESRIRHLISVTNNIYKDSNVDIQLNLVHMQQYDMDDSARSNTILGQIRRDQTIQALRDEHGADEVVIYRPYAGDGACGVAYRTGAKASHQAYAYAHVSINCGDYVTAHEVGHNMGLGHSAAQNSSGAYPYGRGYGVNGEFTTVMAYSSAYNTRKKIYQHSDPDALCAGLKCGAEPSTEGEAHAVLALNNAASTIAAFRDSKGGGGDDGNDSGDDGSTDTPSENLIVNGDNTGVFADTWKVIRNGGDGWYHNGVSFGNWSTGHFGTSYRWNAKRQEIDLWAKGYDKAFLDSVKPEIKVSEEFSKTYCGNDRYKMTVKLLNSKRKLIKKWTTGTKRIPGACDWSSNWKTEAYTFTDYPNDLRYIVFKDAGQSKEYWRGYYGTKMRNASVQLLKTPK